MSYPQIGRGRVLNIIFGEIVGEAVSEYMGVGRIQQYGVVEGGGGRVAAE